MIGGFLGAGKTSFLRKFSVWLEDKGHSVAVITNDQGEGLVDTATFRLQNGGAGQDKATGQITGGCFCCKADQLVSTIRALESSHGPSFILAEPVGSCTDLMATVLRPLEEIYGLHHARTPFAVLVDGSVIAAEHSRFSPDIDYIFRKQMEEAEFLIVSKSDLLGRERKARVKTLLSGMFPEKNLYFVSTKSGAGMDEVFQRLLESSPATKYPRAGMEVDYDLYAEGEARLGWYNGEASLHGVSGPFDGNRVLLSLGGFLLADLEKEGLIVAHLKLSLENTVNEEGMRLPPGDFALLQATSGTRQALLGHRLRHRVTAGKLLINIRAEGSAQVIKSIVPAALDRVAAVNSLRRVWLQEAAFQPGRPVPTHRLI